MELATDNHSPLLVDNHFGSFHLNFEFLNDSQSYDIHVLVILIDEKQIRIYISHLQVVVFDKMNV
jgi:hypothetical protein